MTSLDGPFMTATQLTDYRDEPGYAIPSVSGTGRASDQDPREYGRRDPDGTRRIHVPWQGWQRHDGHPFLERADYDQEG